MPKLLYSVATAATLLSLAACGGAKHNVEATLPDVASKTVVVVAQDAIGDEKPVSDTIQVDENGYFVYDLPFDHASRVMIYESLTPEEKQARTEPAGAVYAIVIPGTPLSITGSMSEYKLEGGAFYDEFAKANAPLDSISAIMSEVYKKALDAQRNGAFSDSIKEVMSAELEALSEAYDSTMVQYIKDNPDSDVSTAMIINLEDCDKGLELLTERAKNGPLSPLYKVVQAKKAEREARQQAARDMVGKPAPEFSLPDPEGKMISLESLRGKYVLVDFWGSWCGWCIRGIPEMKKAYDKYKNVAEFISIDCRDSEEAWKEALDKYQMPWLQVRCDEDCNVSETYCVQGYPTKVIIDPEGVYVTAIVGEGEDGYKTMEEIFGKK